VKAGLCESAEDVGLDAVRLFAAGRTARSNGKGKAKARGLKAQPRLGPSNEHGPNPIGDTHDAPTTASYSSRDHPAPQVAAVAANSASRTSAGSFGGRRMPLRPSAPSSYYLPRRLLGGNSVPPETMQCQDDVARGIEYGLPHGGCMPRSTSMTIPSAMPTSASAGRLTGGTGWGRGRDDHSARGEPRCVCLGGRRSSRRRLDRA